LGRRTSINNKNVSASRHLETVTPISVANAHMQLQENDYLRE